MLMKKGTHVSSLFLAGLFTAFLAISVPQSAQAASKQAALDELSDAFVEIAEKASPAVVFIQVEKEIRPGVAPFGGPFGAFPDDFFERFFGRGTPWPRTPQPRTPSGKRVPYGQGTGFIISSDGYIVTNHHVVGNADRIKVRMADKQVYEAELIGSDPNTEIAVIKIDGKDLPSIPLGDSDALRVGEWVIAIGNPFGLSHSVTSGIVSARGRGNVGIAEYPDFIQTDAAINPGNSGGPLLNLRGQVVGVNTAIYSRSGGYMGIGFAIPVNMVKNVRDQLVETGEVAHGYLGVLIQDMTPDLVEWFDTEDVRGALVAEVSEDSPAEDAGLKRDDIILEMDGNAVEDSSTFRSRIATTPPGTTVDLTILRKGSKLTKEVEIGKQPDDAKAGRTGSRVHMELGMTVQPLTDDLAQRFGYEDLSGVLVSQVEAGSPAAMAGIKPGVLIEEVNRRPVHNVNDFNDALSDSADEQRLLLRIREGRHSRYVTLRVTP